MSFSFFAEEKPFLEVVLIGDIFLCMSFLARCPTFEVIYQISFYGSVSFSKVLSCYASGITSILGGESKNPSSNSIIEFLLLGFTSVPFLVAMFFVVTPSSSVSTTYSRCIANSSFFLFTFE